MMNNVNTMRSAARSVGRKAAAPVPRNIYNAPYYTRVTPVAASFGRVAVDEKELAQKIASLERQIKDANSEARKAPLVAQLNALKGSSSSAAVHARSSSFSAPSRSSSFSAPSRGTASPGRRPVDDKELAQKIAALERQIKDANSEARRAPLLAQLNALKGGDTASAPGRYSSSPARPSFQPARASNGRPSSEQDLAAKLAKVSDKDLAMKIAALERQIKDANSEARKAPLVAQLNALWAKS